MSKADSKQERRPGIKQETVYSNPPPSGWAPMDLHARLGSQLDAATGRLTGDQQRIFADMPSEKFTGPGYGNKVTYDPDGGAVFHKLDPHPSGEGWVHMQTYGV